MNLDETVTLLKLVVAGDRRTIGPEDVRYWQAMLAGVPLPAAVDALVMFRRREPDKWIDPGHIWGLCRAGTDTAAARGVATCDHGGVCDGCKAVHHPGEPCDVLVAAQWPRAIGGVFRAPPTQDEPPPAPDPAAVEAERARQAAALLELAETTPATEEPA